jgi:hypothetical protein
MVAPLKFYRRERGSVSQSPTPTDRALAGDGGSLRLQRSSLCAVDDSVEIKVCIQKQRDSPLWPLFYNLPRIFRRIESVHCALL